MKNLLLSSFQAKFSPPATVTTEISAIFTKTSSVIFLSGKQAAQQATDLVTLTSESCHFTYAVTDVATECYHISLLISCSDLWSDPIF